LNLNDALFAAKWAAGMIEFSTAVMLESACNPGCTESYLKSSFVCKTENAPKGMHFPRRTAAQTSHFDRVGSLILSENRMQRRGARGSVDSHTTPLPRGNCGAPAISRPHPHGCEAITAAALVGLAKSQSRSALVKSAQMHAIAHF